MPEKLLTGVDLNAHEAIHAADPTASDSLATKGYVDGVAQGVRDLHDPVRGTTTANLAITSLVNGLVHDGVTYATGDRIFVRANTAGAENGIYTIGAAGTGVRATDADVAAEITSGFAVTVLEGTTKGTGAAAANPVTYVLTNTAFPVVVGTTALTFAPIGSVAAAQKTAAAGLVEDSTTYAVGQGTGITVNADDVAIDPSLVSRHVSFDCVVTTNPQTFTHNFGTKDVDVTIRDKSTDEIVRGKVITLTNSVSVDFGGAPTAAQFRVTVRT